MGHSRECKVELCSWIFRADSIIFTTTLLPRLVGVFQAAYELGWRLGTLQLGSALQFGQAQGPDPRHAPCLLWNAPQLALLLHGALAPGQPEGVLRVMEQRP